MPSRPSGRALLAATAAALLLPSGAFAATVVNRDAYSTTVKASGGELTTSLSSEQVNYQTDSGTWRPIDTSLETQSDGDLHPQAVDGDVAIPDSLAHAIELEHDGHTASFRLLGATGSADVDDNTASFDNALQGVNATYATRPDGVKETLELATPFSPHSFVYDLTASSSWSAALQAGEVVLRDNSGTERYRISAPVAWDSAVDPSFSNALSLSVSKIADGHWRVTLRPDESWLTSTDRVYPVSIDPDFSWADGTTHFHGAQTCYLANLTQAGWNLCPVQYMLTGNDVRVNHALLKFDIASAIPSNASVTAAVFKAYAPPSTAKAAVDHRLYTVTSDWDTHTTWNNRKTGVPWTNAGGDYSTDPAYTSGATSVSSNPAWYSWNAPLAAVQGWVNGALPNYGFMLKTDDSPGASYGWASTYSRLSSSLYPADATQWPTLDVTWSPGVTPTGERPVWQQPALQLPDGGRLSVNAANGAAFLQPYGDLDTDAGECYDAVPQFNSAEATRAGAFGTGFESSAEQVRTISTASGTQLRGPTGWQVSAAPADRADSAYQTGADLTNGSGTDLVTLGIGERSWSVPSPTGSADGVPAACQDGEGTSVPLTHDGSNRLTGIGSGDDALTLTRAASGVISSIASSSPDATTFTYDSAGRLTHAVLRSLDSVDLTWQTVGSASVPSQVTYASGGTLAISWADSLIGPVVTSATLTQPGEDPQTIAFSGTGATRVLTSPDGTTPTIGNDHGVITGPDTTGPTFEWPNTPDDIVVKFAPAVSKLMVEASASDDLSGLADVRLVDGSGNTVATFPVSSHGAWGYDRTRRLDDQPVTYSGIIDPLEPLYVRATDQAGNVTTKAAVVLQTDAAPPQVDGVAVLESEAAAGGQQGTVMWQSPDTTSTPPMTRTVRWRVGSGAWTTPTQDAGEATVVVPTAGDSVTFEFVGTNLLNGLQTTQTETATVGTVADYDPLPESNADPEFVGPSANKIQATLRATLPNGTQIPLAGQPVSFIASGTRSRDGTDYTVTQKGSVTTDQDGTLTIEHAIPEDFTLTVGDEDFNVAAGSGVRTVSFAAQSYPGASPREDSFCLTSDQHQRMCQVVDFARRRAQHIVPAYWTYPKTESTRPNALSHAYWNAQIEKERNHQPLWYAPHYWTIADIRDLMTLHEWADQHSSKIYDRRSSKMDYWNNARGREMGRHRKDWDDARLCRAVVQRSFTVRRGYFYSNSLAWRVPPVKGQFVYITTSQAKRRNPPGAGCSDYAAGNKTYQVANDGGSGGGGGGGSCSPSEGTWYDPTTGQCTF